ncbi:hypothetical protein [Thalassobius sp. Cn5-15]|uniref:hypothetical protein n=1 Tax=Thalassobius sp. Cn5-15 TaxID=2917763 RepID=UPI001EF35F01|nr:hypothetical protein [Thalassobius sp. Cn5-15]MCG7492013.1 hypothetical protein [Thalassobius sp. Cn5-15]
MNKILAAFLALSTVAQPLYANTSAAEIPSGDALVELVLGKHVSPENGPKGQIASFLEGGVFKQRSPSGSAREFNWRVDGRQICLGVGDQGECFEVISAGGDHITLKALVGNRKENIKKMMFVTADGEPIGKVVVPNTGAALNLVGRVITVEEVNAPSSMKGNKTVFAFTSADEVDMSFVDASGDPVLGGGLDDVLPYTTSGDTLCLVIGENRERCVQMMIKGSDVRLVPIKKGVLQEDDAMIGMIK